MKIYTREGDHGRTRLFSGVVVDKYDPSIEAVGDVDELNAAIGVARLFCRNQKLRLEILPVLQKRLLDVGSALSTPSDGHKYEHHRNRFDPDGQCVTLMESWIDEMDEHLTPLRNFVLPGGDDEANSFLHVARTICRRAERSVAFVASEREGRVDTSVLPFLNRMSDLLFVCARVEADSPESTYCKGREITMRGLSVIVYFFVNYVLLVFRPRCMFEENGRPLTFGIGDNQTLLPFWIVALLAALYVRVFADPT